jgi:Helix-turn-helix domain
VAARLKSDLLKSFGNTIPGTEQLGAGGVQQRQPVLADFLDEEETAAELQVRRRTLRLWRQLGAGPAWIKVGRRVYCNRHSLISWLASCEHRPVRSRES